MQKNRSLLKQYGELGISLKNKKSKKNTDFNQLQTVIFLRTILMVVIALFLVFSLYSFFLQGNLANAMVGVFQFIFRMNYDEALNLYQQNIRNYMELFYLLAIAIVFFIIFRIYLKWFVKYFTEINRGIDALIEENAEEVTLSSELAVTEKKINTIKHTLEKRKTDAQLSEQRKNDLIVYLAHDLKTPLASVIGYLNLMRDEGQISEELREKYLSISLDKAEHLEDLINEFFEIARFNLSNIVLQYSNINLTRLLEQLIYEFRPILKEKNLKCNLNITDSTMLRCDANKIQRVFDNLLRNAVTYSFNDTDIDITAIEQSHSLVIKFVNQGNTIPPERLEQIFEQFYRLDASRGTSGGGAGLGLAIAKQIIELHNGTITAKSEDEQIELEVTLPLS